MIQNQTSNATQYNRHVDIFRELTEIIPMPSRILSFGCSTGEECKSLHKLYFPNSKIVGLDITESIIQENIKNNKFKKVEYFSNLQQITEKFNLIFAMSVLCRWPERSTKKYTFQTFSDTIKTIDSLLEKGGYICIYNSKYIFPETETFKKYRIIDTRHKETGYVTKYFMNGGRIFNYPYFLFQKIED